MVLADGGVVLPAAGPFSCPSVVGALPAGPLLWLESQLVVILVWAGLPAWDWWSACWGGDGIWSSGHLVIYGGGVSLPIKEKGCPFTRTAIGLVF